MLDCLNLYPIDRIPYHFAGMANAFPYQAVDIASQEIRLVEFISAKPSFPIKLSFKRAKLQESPLYMALSYTWGAPFDGLPSEWGDPSATKTLNLDGCQLEIRWNLEATLRALYVDDMPALWVYAPCINQSNVEEKNHQVQMMREIYRNAKTTFVWLGPHSENCFGALEAIRRAKHSWDARPEKLRRLGAPSLSQRTSLSMRFSLCMT